MPRSARGEHRHHHLVAGPDAALAVLGGGRVRSPAVIRCPVIRHDHSLLPNRVRRQRAAIHRRVGKQCSSSSRSRNGRSSFRVTAAAAAAAADAGERPGAPPRPSGTVRPINSNVFRPGVRRKCCDWPELPRMVLTAVGVELVLERCSAGAKFPAAKPSMYTSGAAPSPVVQRRMQQFVIDIGVYSKFFFDSACDGASSNSV